MKLELKHLAPYLPYKLNFLTIDGPIEGHIIPLSGLSFDNEGEFIILGFHELMRVDHVYYKPILRPLSDLHKLIDWNKDGELTSIGRLHSIDKVNEDGDEFYAEQFYVEHTQYPIYNLDIRYFNWWLFEHHFDVFGLIEQDLAIDINTLK